MLMTSCNLGRKYGGGNLLPGDPHNLYKGNCTRMPLCVANACPNHPSKKLPGVSFHRFPKNLELRKKWIAAVNRENWEPSQCSVLCSTHFREEDIDRSLLHVKLKDNAVPELFLPTAPPKKQRKKVDQNVESLLEKLQRELQAEKEARQKQELELAKLQEQLVKAQLQLDKDTPGNVKEEKPAPIEEPVFVACDLPEDDVGAMPAPLSPVKAEEEVANEGNADQENFNNAPEELLQSLKIASYICVVCNKIFTEAHAYEEHVKTHSKLPTVYDCVMCGQSFTCKAVKDSHICLEHTQKVTNIIATVASTAATVDHSSTSEQTNIASTKPSLDGLSKVEHSSVFLKSDNQKKPISNLRVLKRTTVVAILKKDGTLVIPSLEGKKLKKKSSKSTARPSSSVCSFCNKTFNNKNSVRQHIRRCHWPATNMANAPSTSKSDESIVDEILSHKNTPNSSSNEGLEITAAKKSTPKHSKRKSKSRAKMQQNEKKNYTCTVCKKDFENSSTLSAHECSENHFATLSCPVCDKHFRFKNGLDRHHSVVHLKIKKFMCEYCSKCFGVRGTLLNHLKGHTDDKPFQCADCGKSFRRKSNLRHHFKTLVHTKVKEHMCSKCGKEFQQESAMQLHEVVCSAENTNNTISKKNRSIKKDLVFASEDDIYQYKNGNTFNSKRQFVCSTCGKCVNSKKGLEVHQQNQHSTLKPFSCNVCLKRFGHPSSLKQHSYIHKGYESKKKFACSLCDKKFQTKLFLIRHEQMHRGIKPFSCSFCDARFTQPVHLDMHLKVHLGIKNFKCSVCDKRFIASGNLREHETTKHGINVEPVTCDICQVVLPHKYAYYKHTRKHKAQKTHNSKKSDAANIVS